MTFIFAVYIGMDSKKSVNTIAQLPMLKHGKVEQPDHNYYYDSLFLMEGFIFQGQNKLLYMRQAILDTLLKL